jgi:hypothetical protein
MNKIKIIWTYRPSILQDEVEKWIKKENPNIINTSITTGTDYAAISIVYSQGSSEPDINHLLRS